MAIPLSRDPVTVFHNQELLNQAHLDKPWVFEATQELMKNQLLPNDGTIPRSKEELFAEVKRCLEWYLHPFLTIFI